MTAKQWLERGRNLNNEIETLLTAQQRALELACKTSSGSTDDKVQTSRRNTSEERFISYADYERLINEKIDKLYQVQREITDAIYRVDNSTLRTLLVERYINFNTWEQIAVNMNYNYRWILRLHGRALQAIESHIPHMLL